MIGLALPTNIIQISLGVTILGICALMLTAKKSEFPDVPKADKLSIHVAYIRVYQEASTGRNYRLEDSPDTDGTGLSLF